MVTPVRLSVLVVDDDVGVWSVFRRIVSEMPVDLRCAGSIKDALAELAAGRPDILIADYRLGDGDGMTLIEKVQAGPPPLPDCVLHTGEALQRTHMGFDIPVLSKPCPPDALREFLFALLEAKRAAASSQSQS
jgi:CheY-like chemotaxis protein